MVPIAISGEASPFARHLKLAALLPGCYTYVVARTIGPHHDWQIDLPTTIGLRVRLGSMELRSTF
jgi:hypothetical protein